MKQYLELMDRILTRGRRRVDRTGVGTIGLFGEQIRMDMADGFPLLTTKKVHTKSIIYELLWFLKGDTNIKFLQENGVTIWNEWADVHGELGPVYGEQWVKCHGVTSYTSLFQDGNIRVDGSGSPTKDSQGNTIHSYQPSTVNQIEQAVETLRKNPYSRRNIVSAWNVNQIHQMKLPPCHTLWQLYVDDTGTRDDGTEVVSNRLNLHLYARSIDTFLGLPFNIASYAFLLHMLAHVADMVAGELIISFGDVHVYLNHLDQCRLQLSREPRKLPTIRSFSSEITEMTEFRFEDFKVLDYDPQEAIKAPVAV